MNKDGHNANMSENREQNSESQLAVLRDLGNQLQIKAEKMRLLMRAEEGLGDGDYNPYSTPEVTPDRTKYKEIKCTEPPPVKHIEHKIAKQPASAARQRRRSKKIKTSGQTTVDIKQYRPGYTWNRGGRMKELRIRNLARKYLGLWRRRVFGRVTPSQARAHYEQKIVKKTFRAWHFMWWELRKEWRLEVRAECHYRFIMWQKTWQAWKDFVIQQRIKNGKIAVAEQHASLKLKRRYLQCWSEYVVSRREKSAQTRAAVTHHNEHVLRLCWQKWLSSHELVQHRQHMESVALQFWAYRIQAQYWLVWQARLSERRAGVMKQYRAVRHCNTVMVKRCFQSWIKYWARRRQKQQEKDYGMQIYASGLVQRAFSVWLSAYRYRQMLLERKDRITSLAETFQKRRAFLHWRHYIYQRREKYELIAEAENHYRTKLLTLGFSAFRLCVVQKHLKTMRLEMADNLRYTQLLRYGWLTWLGRCENKEELRIVTYSHKAWRHYRLVLLRKSFYQLQLYVEWRHHRKAQYARADAHFYMQEMPKYMFRLKVFVQLMKNKRENTEKCTEFRRENQLARFYYLWVNNFQFSKEYRMNERMAILHYDGKLGKRFFMCWKQKTADKVQEAENMEIAADHYNETLCRKYLHDWRDYINGIRTSQRQDIEASRYHCRKILRRCIQAWRMYTRSRKEKHRQSDKAGNHYTRKLCGKMLAMWLHYVDTQRTIKARAEVMYRRKCDHFLSEALSRWRENVGLQKFEKQSDMMAVKHYTVTLSAKVFTAWHRYSAIHAYKKSETRQWVQSARQQLDIGMLQMYFTKWKLHHSEHVDMKMKRQIAVCHHGNKLKVKVMDQWKLFTKESVRISLLRKQCIWFHNVRVTARAFITWKRAHSNGLVEREKTNLALWHWCLNLHKKVLIAWYRYMLDRRHKKARIQQAMERRRCRLLKDGLTQWLCVADDLSNMRKQFAAQQQAKGVYETYQIVLRCGLYWKNWAMKRYQSRGGPKPVQQRETTHTVSVGKGGHSGHVVLDKGGQSTSTTPRFPVSLFNTPRECYSDKLAEKPKLELSSHVVLPPGPAKTASPVRVKTQSATGLNARQGQGQTRARPRQPSFLAESLKRAGLFVHPSSEGTQTTMNLPEHLGTSNERPEDIERLNLSMLTSRTGLSDKDSVKTLTPKSTSSDTIGTDQIITSARSISDSDITSARGENTTIPFQDLESLRDFGEPVRTLAPSVSEMNNTFQGPQLLPSNKGTQSQPYSVISESYSREVTPTSFNLPAMQGWSSVTPSMPKSDRVALMTPADFLVKRERNISERGDGNTYTPRSEKSAYSNAQHSDCLSTSTTPRILCENTNHNHPLSETRSFRVSDFKEQITPRSVTGSETPRDQLSSLGFDAQSTQSTQSVQSTQSIQKEIVVIRNRLKAFDQKKKKLRTMQKQLKQLCDWLREIEVKGQGTEDEVVANAKQEVQELTADIETLKKSVENEKSQCSILVDRVKQLTALLSI